MMTNAQWPVIGLAVLSMALAVGWRYLKQRRISSRFKQIVARLWFQRTATFFYFVGIPYFTLIVGILTPRSLGLKGLPYFALIDWNSNFLAAQIQQAVTLTLLEGLLDSGAIVLVGSAVLLVLVGVRQSLAHYGVEIALARESVPFTVYYGIHWSFYRAIFWSVTGDLYLGVVLGAGFVMLEWILIYWVQKQQPTRQQQFLINSIILILTSTVFFYVPNLWLLLPIHGAMAAIVIPVKAEKLYFCSEQ